MPGTSDKILKLKRLVQQQRFYKFLEKRKAQSNPKIVTFYYYIYVLSYIETMLLAKSLKFCLPFKPLKYVDFLVRFEFFYRDIRNLEMRT